MKGKVSNKREEQKTYIQIHKFSDYLSFRMKIIIKAKFNDIDQISKFRIEHKLR